uniref:ZP domain-containing protein n=1 Tax=Wuchereria bancrofti TaxID=6293 RepID=A0AAF5Q3S1_WUCBA
MPYTSEQQHILATIYILTTNAFVLFANEIIGEPFISCSADAIYVKWRTNMTFVGHINVRHAPNRFCYQVLVTDNQIELLIPHQDCQVSRTRSLRPAGVIVATSVLISFHPHYVTAGDRVYLLRCLHTRASDQSLFPGSVAPLTTSTDAFRGSTSIPQCEYQIRNLKNNEIVNEAIIGEMVRHRWSCSIRSDQDLCLVITNCFLIASDSKHQLIDNQGCSTDSTVLPDLIYIDNMNVEQNVSVFGVAEKPYVYFQCQISLLPSKAHQCPKPSCPSNRRNQRDLLYIIENDEALILDAVSQQFEIRDFDRQFRKRGCHKSSEEIVNEMNHDDIVCVTWDFFVLIALLAILIALCTVLAVTVMVFRNVRCSEKT